MSQILHNAEQTLCVLAHSFKFCIWRLILEGSQISQFLLSWTWKTFISNMIHWKLNLCLPKVVYRCIVSASLRLSLVITTEEIKRKKWFLAFSKTVFQGRGVLEFTSDCSTNPDRTKTNLPHAVFSKSIL